MSNEVNENKRSEAALAAARHWGTTKRVKLNDEKKVDQAKKHLEVIEITSDDDKHEGPPVNDRTKPEKSNTSTSDGSKIQLLHNPSFDPSLEGRVNKDTVMMSSLVGTKDLKETYQFNFNVDLEFFLQYLHPDFSSRKKRITFITGTTLLDPDYPDTEFIKSKFNIKEIRAELPNQFASHHTKMMVNFFEDDTCEIIIMTCNLTKLDFGGLTQMLWKSGRLSKDKTSGLSGERFQIDLQKYLRKYGKRELRSLAETLGQYDFSSINVELVASAPGNYDLTDLSDNNELYGYGKLLQVLHRNELLIDNKNQKKEYNFLSQVTSIAYPFTVRKGQTSSIFTHLLCPLVFSGHAKKFKILEPGEASSLNHQHENKYVPHIVFPSVAEIAGSNVGFASGQAVHFNYTKSAGYKNQYAQNIKSYLRKWNSSSGIVTGRETVTPHVKMFMCDNGDDWRSLKWILVGSHNLSKPAWGSSTKQSTDPSTYTVTSYELGILVYPDSGKQLVPVYGSDYIEDHASSPVRLPIKLPPIKYNAHEKPWSPGLSYGDNLKDKFGNAYNLQE